MIYLKKKIALCLGTSYGDKCAVMSLLLEILRKIFGDREDWTVHACAGCRRVMVMRSLWYLFGQLEEAVTPRERPALGAEQGTCRLASEGLRAIGDV